MSTQTLTAKLEAVKAVINSPELAKLQAAHATAQKQLDWCVEQHKADPTPRMALDRAAAKQRTAHALDALNKLQGQINQARQESSDLTRMLNSGETLANARQAWRDAADAQVTATRAAQDAQDGMTAINAALEAEKQKATAASLLQRAATLAELGFGDKVETTAAAAGKLLDNANLKIDALLNDAIPAAQKRIDQANTALVQADKATRAAEAEILKAHADCAELALAVAAEDFEKLVLSFHASRIAAFGDFGRRVEHYTVVNDTRFEIEAERIRAQAEQGN